MEASVDQLEPQMHDSVAAMVARRNALVTQRDTYQSLKRTAAGLEKKSVMVHLGGEYFVEMPKEEAVRFLDRRISATEDAVAEINARIGEFNKILNQFRSLDTAEKKNEEDLPVMDIVEELDDDDNVVHVTINSKDVDSAVVERNTAQKPITKIEELPTEHSAVDAAKDQKQPIAPLQTAKERIEIIREDLGGKQDDDADEDRVYDLLQDMGLAPAGEQSDATQIEDSNIDYVLERLDQLEVEPEAKFQIKQRFLENLSKQEQDKELLRTTQEPHTDVQEQGLQANAEVSTGGAVSIDRSAMLQLELIADDFQEDEDFEGPEDDEWDFDFDDDDEEDDDSYADSLLYGGTQFFKGEENSTTNALLLDQIHKLRTEKIEAPATNKPNKKKKSVQFAPELEIFEVEKIKKEDYIEPVRVSRFKQTKQYNRTSKKADPGNPENGTTETVFPANSTTEAVIGDIVEQPMLHDISDDRESASNTDSVITDIFENPNDQLRQMMIQYNSGDSEDKIDGPVIETLHDMEQLNKTIEAMDIDDYEIEHNHGHEDSDGVLADVSENEVIIDRDLSEIIDQDNLDEQVKLDYVRLKEKINRVEGANENEIEITNKPRVSRFRKNLAQNRK